MLEPPESPYRVPFDGSFRAEDAPTRPPDDPGKERCAKRLASLVEELERLQRALYADDRHAVLLVFQAMDAAGKDSTIRAVTTGIDPAGFQVRCFKAPNAQELDHDWLWRTTLALPERGRIGVFNRSHYEETLVVRVHPELLDAQRLPWAAAGDAFWRERFESIRDHERHLARNGTVVLKFWLNVSREEQARRFLDRLEDPDKRWKFEAGDVAEREHWDEYRHAYEAVLNATSRPWAPWYAIPADDKPYMRMRVAEVFRDALAGLDLRRPGLDRDELAQLDGLRARLRSEL